MIIQGTQIYSRALGIAVYVARKPRYGIHGRIPPPK